MEKTVVPLSYIRGLLIEQEGRCAIAGKPLDPTRVNDDHIIPLSRRELSPPQGATNMWLVDKRVNAMKGAMTYDELVGLARLIVDHEARSRALIANVVSGAIRAIGKADFDTWVVAHCDDTGKILTARSGIQTSDADDYTAEQIG